MKVHVHRRTIGVLDCHLSWGARGLLAYILAQGTSHVTITRLVDAGPDGIKSVQAKLHELSEYGYADLENMRNAKGRIVGKSWHVFDHPQSVEHVTDVKHV